MSKVDSTLGRTKFWRVGKGRGKGGYWAEKS